MEDAFDSSDAVMPETQPTQIIPRGGGAKLSWAGDLDCNVEGSKNSSNSSTSYTREMPKYHFHGLAETQTQQYEDYSANEGSQKENAPSSNESKPQAVPPPLAPPAKNTKPPQNDDTMSHPPSRPPNVNPGNAAPKVARAATTGLPAFAPADTHNPLNAKGAKGVSFQSPRAARGGLSNVAATKSVPSRYAPVSRSHKLLPQDSFAGPISQDPEQLYLATAKQFDIPLSELGRISTQETEESTNNTAPQRHKPSMFAYSSRNGQASSTRSAASGHGNILVEGTPSHSGGSQSQSQHSEPSQASVDSQDVSMIGRQPMELDYDLPRDNQLNPSQLSDPVYSQPTSSYMRIMDRSTQPADEATQPSDDFQPTQPSEETQATQPSGETQGTQPSEEVDIHPTPDTGGHSVVSSNHTPATAPSVPSSGRRSLAATFVSKDKPWKLERLQELAAAHRAKSPAANTNTSMETQPATQPSDADEDTGTVAERTAASGWGVQKEQRIAQDLFSRGKQQDYDAMDVVPDSEPPVGTQSSPRKEASVPVSPAKKTFRSVDPGSEPDSGEIVPDSAAVEQEEEEEDEDDDDDVPLAAALAPKRDTRASSKGKAKADEQLAEEQTKPPSKGKAPKAKVDSKGNPKPPPKNKGKQPRDDSRLDADARPKRSSAVKSKAVPSLETGVVPSSVPSQDRHDSETVAALVEPKPEPANHSRNRRKGRKTARPRAAPSSDSPPRRSAKRQRLSSDSSAKREPISSETEDDEMDMLAEHDNSVEIPAAEEEEEEDGTEPADDDYMDVDSKPIVSTSTGKRKRNGERRAPPNVTRASTRAASRTSRFSTPVPRATKQLRNLLTTSASRSSSKSATRVFALWRFDGHYYSGTVHSIQTSPTCKFRIKFDDGTEEHVDISQLRRCEVKPGDNVLVGKSKATVSDTNGGITVEIDDGGGEVTSEEVDFADLRIAGRSLMKQWDDRILSVDSIVPMIKPKVKMSPSPSKASIASGSSINRGRSRVLGKTAFVVTLSTGNEHWEQDKQKAIRVIQNNGGTVLEDWTSIFAIDGKHSQTNHRWVVEPKDVKVKPKGNIDRVFLVSDHFNQKPKFLIALALGIPCVSTKWLDDIEERSEEWQPYLLPAGFCETLGAPVSQLVDLNWGNSPDYITDIMTNAVASKLFAHKSVVCIDATYVPLPKSKNSDGQEASRNVPRIILAMGAERVEAVTERKYVSDPTFESFDYVVMRDGCNLLDDLPEDAACVHLNWVKECLIAGRILPIPLD